MSALIARDLRKIYPSGLEALKGVDLRVEAGDFFALLGPNGAGKSTLIGILTSLVNKTGGNVQVFGHDLDREPERVRALLGVVPQEFNFNLFLPVLEVVINQAGYFGIPRREARVRAEHYLRKLDLWDRRETQMRQLSGGLKRRLMIARALVHQPRVLILDEPTAGVDIEIRRAMWHYLRELNAGGTTIILTTHYLEEAESLCRHLAIINQGEIAATADIAEMLKGLRSETFVLNLRGRLTELPTLDGFVLGTIDESTLEVEVSRDHSINGLFEALSRSGIEVISMRNKQNRLEKLFLDMVDNPDLGQSGTASDAWSGVQA
ncbi:ABC transporter ATP-binding protein [Thiorhodovibrio frisius]|uniref:ABC-type multidrug transport system, ATPase component n=1 Tax=Thiorhodovibrio frisius TaxID=631362 RepID=H8Z551_9GAMM|nr:ABC transporter ATP-binding protein [Thiorhodovibrio frisius]EIC20458.1 ABC-type multidrug transport system, ATPase component [Thiorhodovibrio frisius]WPL21202.1 Daunorubicin/doxorubicin resistance ATP-binding protein DrrA [Thiorhodovibrio frisius]